MKSSLFAFPIFPFFFFYLPAPTLFCSFHATITHHHLLPQIKILLGCPMSSVVFSWDLQVVFLMVRFFSVWFSIVGVPCACPGSWKCPSDVFRHLLLFVDLGFSRQWVGIRFYNSGSQSIEPFLLSFMNGAQLQQLAMLTVCNFNPCHTSSRVPLAI